MLLDDNGFRELSRRIKDIQGHDRLFLSFSSGADAIATWLRCYESGEWDPATAVLYYYHHVPMSWTWEYLDWFEDHFGVTVHRVPGHILLEDLANYLYQTPSRAEAICELQKTTQRFAPLTKQMIQDGVRMWSRLPEESLIALGVKQGDSPMRRVQMRKQQGISAKQGKWYPIWDYENRDVLDIIRRHGCQVPYDYELFGISFENIDYRFSRVLKDQCPNNWARVLEWFPLAESIITRNEHYHPEWPARKGVYYKKLTDMVLAPEEPL